MLRSNCITLNEIVRIRYVEFQYGILTEMTSPLRHIYATKEVLSYAWKGNGVGGEEQSTRGMQFRMQQNNFTW